MNIEIVGIVATLFVLASFLVNDLIKTRLINICGAILFVIYGINIGAFSTWLLNGVLVVVHIYYLIRGIKK
jgi:hypothetical protein